MTGSYTAREKWEIARISAKTLKQAAASDGPHGTADIVDPRLGNRLETIRQRGEARYEREAGAVFAKLDAAEDALARAKADLKTARDPQAKAAARHALGDAKDAHRKADRAARKY